MKDGLRTIDILNICVTALAARTVTLLCVQLVQGTSRARESLINDVVAWFDVCWWGYVYMFSSCLGKVREWCDSSYRGTVENVVDIELI